MKDVYYTPDKVSQADLLDQIENIKEDRTPEDLLFQVLLDWGVDLALPIAQETIDGKSVFFVDDNALAACFDTGLTEEFVKLLAARKPLRAVFRDSGFGSDDVKINVEQIFKLLSHNGGQSDMSDDPQQPGEGELIFYQTPEGTVRVEVLYESETFWLNQKQLFEKFEEFKPREIERLAGKSSSTISTPLFPWANR